MASHPSNCREDWALDRPSSRPAAGTPRASGTSGHSCYVPRAAEGFSGREPSRSWLQEHRDDPRASSASIATSRVETAGGARSYAGLMASVKQVQVTFDCADPRAVAAFWKAALGYVDPPTPGFDSWAAFVASLPVESQGSTWVCQDPDGVGPRLFFQRVPEAKTLKNRLHLDVRVGVGLTGDERVSALEAEAARLETLGARRLRLLLADEENEACLVMQDVEGNEFCLD